MNRNYLFIGVWGLGHWLDNGSRMSGDVHVRFCESLWGRFPRATLLLIMGKAISGRVEDLIARMMERMELRINDNKTRTVNAEKEPFQFLGFTIQKRWSTYATGRKYYHIEASKSSLSRLKKNIKDYLKENRQKSQPEVIRTLNMKLAGWFNYYTMPKETQIWGTTEKCSKYLRETICRHIRRKSQRYDARYSQIAYYKWMDQYGLINIYRYRKSRLVKA